MCIQSLTKIISYFKLCYHIKNYHKYYLFENLKHVACETKNGRFSSTLMIVRVYRCESSTAQVISSFNVNIPIFCHCGKCHCRK